MKHELKQAQREVQNSEEKLVQAFDNLKGKAQHLADRLNSPVVFIRTYPVRVVLASLAAGFAAGWLQRRPFRNKDGAFRGV